MKARTIIAAILTAASFATAQHETHVSFLNFDVFQPGPGDLHMECDGEPVIGTEVVLRLSGADGAVSACLLTSPKPDIVTLKNKTTILVDQASATATAVNLVSGAGSVPVAIPNDDEIVGSKIYAQFIGTDAAGNLLASRATILEIGEVPEYPSFTFASFTLKNRSMTWADFPEYRTTTLSGSVQVDSLGHMNGSVTAHFGCGKPATVTITSSADNPNLFSSTSGKASLIQTSSGFELNGDPISVDEMRSLLKEVYTTPEPKWSDETRAIIAVGKLLSTTEMNRNTRVAQRTGVSTLALCNMWDAMIMALFGQGILAGCDAFYDLCKENGGNFFCFQESGRIKDRIRNLDCDYLKIACRTIGGGLVKLASDLLKTFWSLG